MLSRLPGATVTFVASQPGPCRSENEMLALTADAAFTEVTTADVLVVPGGLGTRRLMDDPIMLGWLRGIHTDVDLDDVGVHRLAAARRGGDPAPPFSGGSPATSPPEIVELVRRAARRYA